MQKKTDMTQKQVAVILKKIKTNLKSAKTLITHELAAVRGILNEKAVIDVGDVSKLEESLSRVLEALQGPEVKK